MRKMNVVLKKVVLAVALFSPASGLSVQSDDAKQSSCNATPKKFGPRCGSCGGGMFWAEVGSELYNKEHEMYKNIYQGQGQFVQYKHHLHLSFYNNSFKLIVQESKHIFIIFIL